MRIVPSLILSSLLLSSLPVKASDADCSIWLCLPMGFPSGCSEAKSAFKHRIKKLKPPLPNFLSCLATDVQVPAGTPVSTMDAKYGVAAIIKETKQCLRWIGNSNYKYCAEWKTVPKHIIKGQACRMTGLHNNRQWRPENCIGTTNWVDTYMDGNKYGETFYYN
ncbi:hypothetical protein VXS05_18575 [Photobacterium toruni]|uniref:hypothetical protein n=1 Tax=Photobacterium toruni TaxID=1935446 RepID=UPI002E17C491|nr:hypothetical protein [Photobacterium toruni]